MSAVLPLGRPTRREMTSGWSDHPLDAPVQLDTRSINKSQLQSFDLFAYTSAIHETLTGQTCMMQVYRVVRKTDTQFYLWDNFGNSTPILTILSLLQAKIYGA